MFGRSGNSNWTIEDDFRLRKAAKGGVSFEQLAKGEVQFSKKYTFKELHDRWHAILYDPVVSAERNSKQKILEVTSDSSDDTFMLDYTTHIADNMHKLARLGVGGLADHIGLTQRFCTRVLMNSLKKKRK
ncbi:putative forkhead-associated domain-containing protein [Tanacetum coccineum]